MTDCKTRFSEFNRVGYFSRVSATHIPELYIGLNENGNKSIELRGKFSPQRIAGTTSIDVTHYKNDQYNIIRFSLLDEEIGTLFCKFCDDLIEQTVQIKKNSESYSAVTNRYLQWRKLFINSKNNFLSEAEIMGLIGEICFLKSNLAERLGLSNALHSWSGQDKTHKDFSYDNLWSEVKTIHCGSQTVKISSIEQLDSNEPGELVIYSFEKMSEKFDGITLNKLFLETRFMFENVDDQDLFTSKVYAQGYEYNDFYDNYVYKLISFARYSVNCDFPKITGSDLPAAICKAKYEILISGISDFIIKEN